MTKLPVLRTSCVFLYVWKETKKVLYYSHLYIIWLEFAVVYVTEYIVTTKQKQESLFNILSSNFVVLCWLVCLIYSYPHWEGGQEGNKEGFRLYSNSWNENLLKLKIESVSDASIYFFFFSFLNQVMLYLYINKCIDWMNMLYFRKSTTA